MRYLRDMTEQDLKTYMGMLAQATESIMPAADNERGRALFVILVFDDPGLAQYVSNANRSDIITAMRECADRLESKEDIPR